MSEARKTTNDLYYARIKSDPARYQARRARENARRRAKAEHTAERARQYYWRERERVLFAKKLYKLLMNVRRAEIKRGRIPYDG